jgi:hypothetical protein
MDNYCSTLRIYRRRSQHFAIFVNLDNSRDVEDDMRPKSKDSDGKLMIAQASRQPCGSFKGRQS